MASNAIAYTPEEVRTLIKVELDEFFPFVKGFLHDTPYARSLSPKYSFGARREARVECVLQARSGLFSKKDVLRITLHYHGEAIHIHAKGSSQYVMTGGVESLDPLVTAHHVTLVRKALEDHVLELRARFPVDAVDIQ